MVQGIDEHGHVFGHVTADVVVSGEQFLGLVHQVCGDDLGEHALLEEFIEFLHAFGEQAEGRAKVDVPRAALL